MSRTTRTPLRKSQYDSGWALLRFDNFLSDIPGTTITGITSIVATPDAASLSPLTIGADGHTSLVASDGRGLQVWIAGGAPNENGTILARGTLSSGGTFGELFEYSIIGF